MGGGGGGGGGGIPFSYSRHEFELKLSPGSLKYIWSVSSACRLLTMPSGERIQFGPNVNFLFESHDLSCASPATISRMGMIFFR